MGAGTLEGRHSRSLRPHSSCRSLASTTSTGCGCWPSCCCSRSTRCASTTPASCGTSRPLISRPRWPTFWTSSRPGTCSCSSCWPAPRRASRCASAAAGSTWASASRAWGSLSSSASSSWSRLSATTGRGQRGVHRVVLGLPLERRLLQVQLRGPQRLPGLFRPRSALVHPALAGPFADRAAAVRVGAGVDVAAPSCRASRVVSPAPSGGCFLRSSSSSAMLCPIRPGRASELLPRVLRARLPRRSRRGVHQVGRAIPSPRPGAGTRRVRVVVAHPRLPRLAARPLAAARGDRLSGHDGVVADDGRAVGLWEAPPRPSLTRSRLPGRGRTPSTCCTRR